MVFHQATLPWLFLSQNRQCRILLAVASKKATNVSVLYGDPFDCGEGPIKHPNLKEAHMNHLCTNAKTQTDYFVCTLTPFSHKLRYHFSFTMLGASMVYGENGLLYANQENRLQPFAVPYLFDDALYCPTHCISSNLWYQVFPDRFASEFPASKARDFTPTRENFFGGKLKSICRKIPYLKALGITGLYLTPVFQSPSNHRYDTISYSMIDPRLGTAEDMRILSDTLHQNNMKLMLDGVFNHTSSDCPEWQDVLAHGQASPYKNWFVIYNMDETQQVPTTALSSARMKRDPPYECFAFAANMPKWNTEEPAVQEHLLCAVEAWMHMLKVDAWRLDVPDEVSMNFLRLFRKRVKQINPSISITGEIWGAPWRWLSGDTFDGVMNYPLYFLIRDFVLQGIIDAPTFCNEFTQLASITPLPFQHNAMNFIGNHDLPRPLSLANGATDAVKGAFLLLMLLPGNPCLYYGDERTMLGGADPNNRGAMLWQSSPAATDMYHYQQLLIRLRKSLSQNALESASVQAIGQTTMLLTLDCTNFMLQAFLHSGIEEAVFQLKFLPETHVLLGNATFTANAVHFPAHGFLLLKAPQSR